MEELSLTACTNYTSISFLEFTISYRVLLIIKLQNSESLVKLKFCLEKHSRQSDAICNAYGNCRSLDNFWANGHMTNHVQICSVRVSVTTMLGPSKYATVCPDRYLFL